MGVKPLLSICIPTYNRGIYLKECLDSIINQDDFNEEEMEIVISDNASKDNTTQIAKEYQKKHTNIIYHRNNKNIGAEKNMTNLILKLARGEYIWLFGDDDLMSPIGINKTINAIKHYSIDILLSYRMDFTGGNNPNNFINNENGPTILYGVGSFSDFISTDIKKYYRRYAELFTFISIMCFKKSVFQDNFNNMNVKYSKKYMNYVNNRHYFGHSIILYGLLEQKSIIGIYKDTLTFTRMGNQSWNMGFKILKDISDVFIKFYINHKKINKKVLITFSRLIISWIFPTLVGTIKPYINKNIFEYMKKTYFKITKK